MRSGHANQLQTWLPQSPFNHKGSLVSSGAFLTVEVAHLLFRVARSRDGVRGNCGLNAGQVLGCQFQIERLKGLCQLLPPPRTDQWNNIRAARNYSCDGHLRGGRILALRNCIQRVHQFAVLVEVLAEKARKAVTHILRRGDGGAGKQSS